MRTCWSASSNRVPLIYQADDLSGEQPGVPPMKKLEDLIHLAELCVDLLQQNEEHYAEVGFALLLFGKPLKTH